MSQWSRLAAILLLAAAAYLAIGLHHLGVVPPVHEDEPWQVSVGWKVTGGGVLASDQTYGRIEIHRRRR